MNQRILGRGLDLPARNDSDYLDHISHAKPGIRPFPSKLYVITPVFNPMRYRVRYELYRQFAKHVEESGAILITVELAYRDRPFEVTEANNPYHVQLRTDHLLWYKEPMINIGLRHLPSDWEYVAWIDADTKFMREDWAQETIQLLQHYQVIQMWSQIQDLTPNFEMFDNRGGYLYSYMYNYHNNRLMDAKSPGYGPEGVVTDQKPQQISTKQSRWYGPPGLAWAARREAIDHLGGVIDWGIVGSGDSYMASALVGELEGQLHKEFHPDYLNEFRIWQDRAERFIRRNVGYMPGVCLHYYHGKKVNRKYVPRNQILIKHQFNPRTDLKRDWQGLWQLCDHGDRRSIDLRDDLTRYFSERDEDCTSL